MANTNYEAPYSSEEIGQASRLTANVNSLLGNVDRSNSPECEYTGRGGTHTGKASHFVNFNGERGDQTTAVCAGHLNNILENAATVQRSGGPAIDEQLSHTPITPQTGRAHQEKRAIEKVEVNLSAEEPLRAYYGGKNRGAEGNALFGRENDEVGRPGPITDRERHGEEPLSRGAAEKVIDSSATYGGRQPTPDTTAVDKYGRGLYVDKGPGKILGGQWTPAGVTRLYRFEKEDTSPPTMDAEKVDKNKTELTDTLLSQAKSGVKQPKNSKKVIDSAHIGEGTGTIDEVMRIYKAGGDYMSHAKKLGLSEGDVSFHIENAGQKSTHGGRFVKGTDTNAWRQGGKVKRNAPAVAVPIGSQEDIDSRFEKRSSAEVAVSRVRGAQQETQDNEAKLNAAAEKLRRIEEFRKNFETGGNK